MVLYDRTYGDGTDDSGHGSHVAGSIAGNAEYTTESMDMFCGMAPEAKLAFHDLETPEAAAGGWLNVPYNIGNGYFKGSYDAGARIHRCGAGRGSGEAIPYNISGRLFLQLRLPTGVFEGNCG